MNEYLQVVAKRIIAEGPSRVVINGSQEATSSRLAREVHGVTPDVIFIRGDGWSLGAPRSLAAVAFGTWPDAWIGFIERPSVTAKPISEYRLG